MPVYKQPFLSIICKKVNTMNRFAKALLIAVLLLVIPVRISAQNPVTNTNSTKIVSIRDYENGFLFNVFEIANVEERIQLASALATSDIWLCNPTDNPGELFIRPNSYNADIPIYAEFDYLKMTLREEYEQASSLPKEEFAEIVGSWAQNISNEYYNFLISDHLDRANHCMDAEPFCTSNVYNFPALNSGYSWSGPNYGCLGSSPTNKHSFWYYMRIGVAGNITIKIEAGFDVDFALWGPFSNETDPCPTTAGQSGMLTAACTSCPSNTTSPNFYPSGNLHDCSFSGLSYEYAHVVNGQVGQYYILLITNYSGSSGDITFQKYAGDGETDCDIMPPLVSNDGPYCVGDVIHLTANGQSGATYSWTGPGGFTSTQQSPTRPNCTMAMAGTYTCTISLNGQSSSATTQVVVYPKPTANFTATTVCKGNPTQFTSTSTTNPSGQQITSYQWNFGDNTPNSSQQNPTHTYANAGNYQVTLTVGCGNGHCTSTKTQTVTVYAAPIANAGPDQTIPYGGTAQLSGSGGAGQFNYQWSPANMVVNANAQNTQTVPLTSDQTYTLTVSNPQGQCTSSDQVTIHISGSAMTVSAGPNISICQGGSGQIYVNAGGGTGNITYSWTPTTGLSNPNISNPIASPSQTTTYTCHVSDGTTSQNASVTVTVNDVIVEDEYHSICLGDIYYWHGTPYDTPDTYQFDTITPQGCDKTIYLHLDQYPSYDETTITVERCYGESYAFYGTNYTVPGHYEVQHTDHTVLHGCDSIVRLDLTIWPENEVDTIEVSLCPELLPYHFYGVDYWEDTDVTVLDTDNHGCDQPVRLLLTVSDYYKPDIQTEYVCYNLGDTPTFDWNPIGDYHFDLHEDGFYTDTLPTSACEGIFRLNLSFQQIPEVEHTYDTVCDSYYWPINGQTYGNGLLGTQVIEDEYRIPMNPFPCDRVYQLHLTINKSDNTAHQEYDNECDSIPFEWFGNTIYFKEDGIYTFPNEEYPDGQTALRCDTTMTVTVMNMKYTPKPVIDCSDQNVENPHWPITATEFNVNRYTYFASDPKSDATWINEQCEWSISKESWRIVPSDDNRSCTVYAMDWVPDSICLSFKAVNRCSESEIAEYWLHPSFYGIEEQEAYPAVVDIIPNPNNGQMQLRFENMEGKLNIKVYTMSGALVDSFELKTIGVGETYDYSMKRLVNGVYFFTITDGKRSVTKKVVIIH